MDTVSNNTVLNFIARFCRKDGKIRQRSRLHDFIDFVRGKTRIFRYYSWSGYGHTKSFFNEEYRDYYDWCEELGISIRSGHDSAYAPRGGHNGDFITAEPGPMADALLAEYKARLS